jgi:hypothetical protein
VVVPDELPEPPPLLETLPLLLTTAPPLPEPLPELLLDPPGVGATWPPQLAVTATRGAASRQLDRMSARFMSSV